MEEVGSVVKDLTKDFNMTCVCVCVCVCVCKCVERLDYVYALPPPRLSPPSHPHASICGPQEREYMSIYRRTVLITMNAWFHSQHCRRLERELHRHLFLITTELTEHISNDTEFHAVPLRLLSPWHRSSLFYTIFLETTLPYTDIN